MTKITKVVVKIDFGLVVCSPVCIKGRTGILSWAKDLKRGGQNNDVLSLSLLTVLRLAYAMYTETMITIEHAQ